MMLHRGQPAVGDGLGELAVLVALDVELAVLGAVVDCRSLEGIGLDVEIRTRRVFPVAQELRIRGQFAGGGRVVAHVIDQIDGIAAAGQHKGLGDGETMAVAPDQRHAQFGRARTEFEGAAARAPGGQMRGRGFARLAGETRLQHVQRRRTVLIEEPYRYVRGVLAQRIVPQVRTIEFTALQVDVELEHVGAHVQHGGGGHGGRRRRNRRRSGLRHRYGLLQVGSAGRSRGGRHGGLWHGLAQRGCGGRRGGGAPPAAISG